MSSQLFLRGCHSFALLHLVLSVVCSTNKLCRPQLLTSSLKSFSSYINTNRMPFTLLNITALQKSNVKSEQHCLKKCYALSTCSSINVLSNVSASNEMECQLLTQQMYSNKDKLTYQQNSTHYTVLNAGCEKGLCLNNSTCVPNYNDDSSTCTCVSSIYDGTFCERELKVVLLRYNRQYSYGNDVPAFIRETFFKLKSYLASATCLLTFNGGTVGSNMGGQAFAYFVPPETGIYYFTIACSYFCTLYISTNGKQDRRIYHNAPGKGQGVYIEENQIKFLEMLITHYPNVNQDVFSSTFSLGVTFPNGTLSNPVDNRYLLSRY